MMVRVSTTQAGYVYVRRCSPRNDLEQTDALYKARLDAVEWAKND